MQYAQRNPIPIPEMGATTSIASTIETVFDWEYDLKRKNLLNLYEKGKALNWNASDLPWETEVDMEKIITQRMKLATGELLRSSFQPPVNVSDEFLLRMSIEQNAFMLSQFLHGDQGALVATAKLVQACPDEESKFYAASQVLDEARHQSRRRSWVPLFLAVVFIAVSGFFMTELAGGVPPDPIVWLMLAMAGGLLAWRVRLR